MKNTDIVNQKVGLAIVTYTINYGTFLQAFATQTAIENIGYETTILNIDSVIDDVSKARRKYFIGQLLNYSEVKSYVGTVSAIIQKKINPDYKEYYLHREIKFKEFHDRYFKIGPVCDSWDGLRKYCYNFSSIVVGSDQLWRPANIAGDYYTLNFVPDDINKISYATSFGLKNIRENQKAIATKFLSRIQFLSCREQSGVQIIKKITDRDAKLVCDPTLLLTKDEWDSFVSEEPIVKGDYILTYLLSNNLEHRKFVRKLAEKTTCRVVGVLHGAGYVRGDERFVDESPKDVGPFEFLNLIKYAKYVCTDSFHGCVFSTIFEKNYYAFKRFSDKNKMSTNTRVTNLLDRFGLSDRLIEKYDSISTEQIDYLAVNERVHQFRDESKDYLMKALREGEKNNND